MLWGFILGDIKSPQPLKDLRYNFRDFGYNVGNIKSSYPKQPLLTNVPIT